MSRKNKKVRMSSRIDLADALRKESSLSAFTFDGPYRLTGHDLLDNMYCADNGRWYETPVDWYGLARAARQTSWRNTCDAEAILNHGGMCRMARMRFSFALAKCAT